MNSDFYELLKLLPSASQEEIKRSYYELAKTHHPDKNEDSTLNFVLLQQAYETLKDPELRKRYDEQYARTQTLAGVARVSAEVDLDEMDYDEGSTSFRYPCRCGSFYEISEAELVSHVELVFCSGCTLQIKVLYELQEEE